MDKQTADMTKAELVAHMASRYTGTSRDWAAKEYGRMTKDQLREQVACDRGEMAPSQLTYKYDH